MDEIQFPYRSPTHLLFLHIVEKSGAWAKQDLEVEYDFFVGSDSAHEKLANGEIEFVDGNHVSPYAERTRGDEWVYIGQTVDRLPLHLAFRPDTDVDKVEDLKGKTIATTGFHPRLNTWLYLKQRGLDPDAGDYDLVQPESYTAQFEGIMDGEFDAAFVTPPQDLFSQRWGMDTIELDELPMIWFTTASSSFSYVRHNPDIARRFLKGLIQGIAFFKQEPDETIDIIKSNYDFEVGDVDQEAAEHIYESFREVLLPNLYPSPEAIGNVYREAVRRDPAAENVDPLELWDFMLLREIVDSGFVEDVYED